MTAIADEQQLQTSTTSTDSIESPLEDTTDTQPLYSIEQVATRTGMTKRTLRYYEEIGLLPPTDRTGGNYRRYTESDVQRLEHIKELRDLLSFSLLDIRALLAAEDERGQLKRAYQQETDMDAKLVQLDRADELIHRELFLVEQKIAALEQMRTSLHAKLEKHQHSRHDLHHNQ